MFDGEVMLVQLIQIETQCQRTVRDGEQRQRADGEGEIGADVEGGGEDGEEQREGDGAPGVREKVVVREGVEHGTGGADVVWWV